MINNSRRRDPNRKHSHKLLHHRQLPAAINSCRHLLRCLLESICVCESGMFSPLPSPISLPFLTQPTPTYLPSINDEKLISTSVVLHIPLASLCRLDMDVHDAGAHRACCRDGIVCGSVEVWGEAEGARGDAGVGESGV
jgi:hypothetical protein